MTIGPAPICLRCRHLQQDDDAPIGTPARCDAFPHGIPREIYIGGFDHRKEFPGDGGVRFEPVEETADQAT